MAILFRKIQSTIEQHFTTFPNKVLIVTGARQIGKTFIIRHTCKSLFSNFVEINLLEDANGERNFAGVSTIQEFYMQVGMLFGKKLGNKADTLIFLDEIQAYPHLLTLLKFLNQDGRFSYIASGSLLGVTLSKTSSIPMGSIRVVNMFPLDFEEFLIANNVGQYAIEIVKDKFIKRESLDEAVHNRFMGLFKRYLLTGGLPDAVNTFIETLNIVLVRDLQNEIHDYYAIYASKYDAENKLKIRRIYDMIPSLMENTKKRIVLKDIEQKKGKKYENYKDEFDYLINSGIALEVKAISTPKFPLIQSSGKNLLKLYLNDVGILTSLLYKNNIQAVLNVDKGVNLGAVYESVVASELKAHGHNLFYYDNKSKGEVDFLIDDYDNLAVLPIEVKSGKDYYIHSALNNFIKNEEYDICSGIVLSNRREVKIVGKITYLPIYYVMFL